MNEPNFDFDTGEVLLVNKPINWTSFDVVKKLKFGLKIKKIGHAGTLDPLATGLLILCTGKQTKQIEKYQAQEKEYTGILVIGKTTPSIDLETDFDSETDYSHINKQEIEEVRNKFTGLIEQVPPQYSAIKVNGERVYKNARKGIVVPLKSRQVTVSTFEIVQLSLPEIHFRIVCTKGTYIRSLVRDFGKELNVGAYLKKLERTRIGEYLLTHSYELDQLLELGNPSPK